jgi:hypothetical protein
MNANIMEDSLVKSENGDVAIYTPITNKIHVVHTYWKTFSFMSSSQLIKKMLPSNNSYSKNPTLDELPTH